MIMWIHNVLLYFPGYKCVEAPLDKAVIRHYRDTNANNWTRKWLPKVQKFGKFTLTYYPSHFMAKLHKNVKERLSRIYRKI
ncbi:unnamed protein product [Cylicocyclus nassatus]|uniref:Glycosyltransferase family 92 protein n=1 Tax=Cylicocyclus nassatus TaxID=53992 RepID=A0AA36MEJ3_CYLNA|nr:unnamed protein product [Cylicocyclus nassatus]